MRCPSAVTQSIEVIRKRIDEFGTTEPVVQRQGTDRVLVEVPGVDDPQRLKDLIGTTAKLSFHLVNTEMSAADALSGRPPSGTVILYDDSDPPVPELLDAVSLVNGENLVDAQPAFHQSTNEPIVTFRFDSKGGSRFCQVSRDEYRQALRHCVGQNGYYSACNSRCNLQWVRPDIRVVHR